ncbi:MAG: hypothetical protein NMNS01_21670 [Nitrosomonas sp.]|nr:MAG: hypothetical protein NMNS01_21670 [Nitrosomonas sp.]
MTDTKNARNLMLEDDETRLLPVQLPDDYTTTGDHSGTLSGSAQSNYQNNQITLSSNGILQNAGGGQVTNGASIGSLNAGNITTGTLSADRIGANSITASKIASNTITANELAANSVTTNELNVSTLSAITANLGTVTAGDITGTADIDISGLARFEGNNTVGGFSAAVHANRSNGAQYGVVATTTNGSGAAIRGSTLTPGAVGVHGSGGGSGGVGVVAFGQGGANALTATGPISLLGTITISTQTISNLTAGSANNVSGSNVSGTVANATNASNSTNATNASNSNSLGGTADSGWTRQLVTDSGTAAASSYGFVLTSTVSGVRTRATGGRNVVIESFSDEELKHDIKPETLGLNFLMKLQPITYQVNHNPGITYHGLGARATEKILKRENDSLCITHDDGVKGIDYNSVIGVLIKAVQELNAKVNELTKKPAC